MRYKSVLILSDNVDILSFVIGWIESHDRINQGRTIDYACYQKNAKLAEKTVRGKKIAGVDVKKEFSILIEKYDMIISAHTKQIFPKELVTNCKCINIHPGYNPYNRGWYPQVFSIINGKQLGATIHEIDEKIDHGSIIAQEKVKLFQSDTSLSAYKKVQEAELRLVKQHLESVMDGDYKTHKPSNDKGNLNLIKDFREMQKIDLTERVTYKEAIDRLRALTHPPFKNAYIVDEKTKKRIWISLDLEEE